MMMLCCIISTLYKFHTYSVLFSSQRRLTTCALVTEVQTCSLPISVLTHMHVLIRRGLGDDSLVLRRRHARQFFDERDHAPDSGVVVTGHHAPSRHRAHLARKSVVSGQSVSARVDLGGCRILNKKTIHQNK